MPPLSRIEPVRLYAILSAAIALAAHYVPDLPVALILALVAALLGIGEGVRSRVTPTARPRLPEAGE